MTRTEYHIRSKYVVTITDHARLRARQRYHLEMEHIDAWILEQLHAPERQMITLPFSRYVLANQTAKIGLTMEVSHGKIYWNVMTVLYGDRTNPKFQQHRHEQLHWYHIGLARDGSLHYFTSLLATSSACHQPLHLYGLMLLRGQPLPRSCCLACSAKFIAHGL